MTNATAVAQPPVAVEAHSPAPSAATMHYDHATRDAFESIIVAMIVAFLFRGFVAEAFVIPTGSMAPTLQGRHMDVVCDQCRFQYRTGASVENYESGRIRGEVTRTRCPICRYSMVLDKEHNANHASFNGDRILVSKSAYQLGEPRRWDIIVFRYPGDAKTNYIKRLAGLPGETIRIRHGDLYILDPETQNQPLGRQRFVIARKPPETVQAMLHLVDDTRFVSKKLREIDWPSRWNHFPSFEASRWREVPEGAGFVVEAGDQESWLRYRHLIPRAHDWEMIEARRTPDLDDYAGQLITDYYAYNDSLSQTQFADAGGDCWVGDLAVQCDFEVLRGEGELMLDLVEGGTHYRCTVSISTGDAWLSIVGPSTSGGGAVSTPLATGKTSVRASGRYSLQFANVDDQLILWVDGKVVPFEGATTYVPAEDVVPKWSPRDAGDLAPAGVAARRSEVYVSRLRVFRDVYYRAVEPIDPYKDSEYDRSKVGYGFDIAAVMADPHTWRSTPLFTARRSVTYKLDDGQYFPLGDNSPQSKDARLWSERKFGTRDLHPPPFVERDMLIGKALVIYWPHAWRIGTRWLPIVPNYQRIGLIR